MYRAVVVGVILVAAIGLGMLGLRLGADLAEPPVLGVQEDGELAACPDADNCVSSQADDPRHAVDPLSCPDATLAEVVEAVDRRLPRTEVVTVEDDYAHLTARTALIGFIDDVELQPEDGDVVHVRSASRLGQRDFGTNERRVEALREEVVAAGVCR